MVIHSFVYVYNYLCLCVQAGNAGIVVCEASKPKRIIALGCATKELHAVPKVLLRFPNALKGCEVYMSRKPCNYCAILLVQGQYQN